MFEKSPGIERPETSDEASARAPPRSPLELSTILPLIAIAVVLVAGAILLVRAFA